MKICVISTTILPCPPIGYSGLEMLAWQMAEGLKLKGHEVTLIAPKESKTNVNLIGTNLKEAEQQAYSNYWQKLPNFDVIIDSSWEKWSYILKMEGKLTAPILGVLHAPVHTMYVTPPPVEKPCLVSISKDQADGVREHLKINSEVAYNGCDVDFYKPTDKIRQNRYLFLARMSSIKGPDIAVRVAKNCKVGLDLVGDDTLTGEPELSKSIQHECSISSNLMYIGPQNRNECVKWFGTRYALLHPNKIYREPFGLAPVESQLCGMPVIAWDYGAMRETIKHGETGWLVKTEQEMQDAIKNNVVASMNRERCREWASQFSYHNMISRYEELCKKAIDKGW